MKIVVAGGTGTAGRQVVAVARERGHDAVPLWRSLGTDVTTGAGLADALDGADAVVDATNLMTLSARAAIRFFETGTANLLSAGRQAGVGHHVALSIVGIDEIPEAYYRGKLAQERAVAVGPIPHTIARVGQFHEFAGQLLARMKGPIALLPRLLMRPVAGREVGEHVVDLVEAGPTGRAPDLVGPRDEELADLARRTLAHRGSRQRVVGLRLPGAYGRGLASGALRGGPGRVESATDFDQWLAGQER